MIENIDKSILIVEDNKIISLALKKKFEQQGYVVYQAFSGDVVERIVIRYSPNCILLDIGLPNVSGFEVCQELNAYYKGPIVFLTADDSPETEVKSIQLGGADFILKTRPFSVIHARVEHHLQKSNKSADIEQDELIMDNFYFNKKNHLCKYKNKVIELSNHEFELLYFLLIHKNELLSRDHIYKSLKGIEYDGVSRGLDISISRIKKKLTAAGLHKNLITTVRSKGYKLQSERLAR